MPFFAHDGIQFHYRDCGSGIPFVFQHGLGADANQTFELFQPPAGIRLLTFDCRGHGDTRPLGAEKKISVETFTEDLRAFLDTLRIDHAIIGGISMGAAMALRFALLYPERVLGLVLSRPAWLDQSRSDNLQVFSTLAQFIRRHGAVEGAKRYQETEAFQQVLKVSPDNASSLLGQFTHPRAEETVAKLERIPNYVPQHTRAAWKKIRVPTLVLANQQDAIHPFEFGTVLARSIPGAQLVEIAPKSISLKQHTADVQRHVSQFLSRNFTRGRARRAAMRRITQAAPAFLGLDCGGTRSVAVCEYGGRVRRVEAGPGNVGLLNDSQLLALFRELSSVHKGLCVPSAVAIGMAGAGIAAQRQRIERAAAKVWPRTPCVVTGDLDTALAAAEIDEQVGKNGLAALVVVLSGTGSVFCGKNARGHYVRVGGWGHVVGDKGSAYEIGLRAIKAVLYYHDRDGKVPPLGRRLLGTLLLNELREFPEWVIAASKTDIAALAREVSSAAIQGDKIARDILAAAAQSLAKDALTCASRLARRGQRVKFVLTGSVLLNQPAFSRRVAKLIREGWPRAEVARLKHEPALGALAMAKQLSKAPGLAPSPLNGERAGVRGGNVQHAFRDEGVETNHPSPSIPLPVEGRGKPEMGVAHWTSDLGLSSAPTEQRHPRSMKLDKLPLGKAIGLMLSEDEKVPRAILAEKKKIEGAIQLIVRSFKSGGRLFYVGAGTSGRLGVLDASECPPTFRTDPEMVQGIIAGGQTALWRSIEGAEDDPAAGARAIESRGITKRDTVVGIAASGRTPFVWGALDEANHRGAATVMLTFNPSLKIPREHQPTILIAPNIGPEILTGSTRLKSGTATKLILNMFTTLAMVRIGKVLGNLMVDVKPTNVKLRDRAVRIVGTLAGCTEVAARAALERSGWVIKSALRRLA
ncbi:MAG TPA: N-acetylmuramic acid 6-phosphate etherase [Methylomirabilota bacterium]|nr:N-acetylmuramic acid 6-phosphate etherase [Methylomirabilota bacterium]